jgi:hypothetical protein
MRAAVVGGGAYMAGKHIANSQADEAAAEADQDDRISALEAQQYQQQPPPQYQQAPPQYQQPPPQYQQAPPQYQQAPAPAAADSGTSSMIDQLNQLAALHEQGVLSDDEFTAAKAKLFGS